MAQHSHSHSHSHHHHQPSSYGRAFAIGIFVNLIFVAIEFGFGLKIDSLALIADAGHNLSDVAGLIIAWGGMTIARRHGSVTHSYGWKKASILAAFGNAVFLMVAMGSLLWEALERFQTPTSPDPITVMAVAGIGIVINSVTAWLFFAGSEHDLNIRGAFLHMAADALVSLGVVVAGALTLYFGWTWTDPVISILISVIIVIGTAKLFFQSLHLLFDGVPESVNYQEVQKFLSSQQGVEAVLDLHIWAMSTTEVALTAHLKMPGGSPGDDFLVEIDQVLHNRFHIEHVTVQISRSTLRDLHCMSHS